MNLQQLIEEAGYETRSYSGRGMYGKECLGVCTENVNVIAFIYDIMETSFDQDRADLEEDIMQIREAKTDSMGKGMIVYFPNVPYNKDEDEDEEEDEEEESVE